MSAVASVQDVFAYTGIRRRVGMRLVRTWGIATYLWLVVVKRDAVGRCVVGSLVRWFLDWSARGLMDVRDVVLSSNVKATKSERSCASVKCQPCLKLNHEMRMAEGSRYIRRCLASAGFPGRKGMMDRERLTFHRAHVADAGNIGRELLRLALALCSEGRSRSAEYDL